MSLHLNLFYLFIFALGYQLEKIYKDVKHLGMVISKKRKIINTFRRTYLSQQSSQIQPRVSCMTKLVDNKN